MSKKLLSALLVVSLLSSSAGVPAELKIEEDQKTDVKKASWVGAQYVRAKDAVKKVPNWVWWTSGSVVSVALISGVSVYYYKTGGFSSFLSWASKMKSRARTEGFFFGQNKIETLPIVTPERPRRAEKEKEAEEDREEVDQNEDLRRLQRDLKKVKDAVVDLEREAYGTTFLDGSPKVSVDGRDILIIKPTDDNPA